MIDFAERDRDNASAPGHTGNAPHESRGDSRSGIHPGWVLIALALVYFGVFRLLIPICFVENDDGAMMQLASGGYSGAPTSYLVFINYYLAAALAALYTMTGEIAWYPTLFLSALSLAVALLGTRVWIRRSSLGMVELALFCAATALVVLCTLQMQFTTLAGISFAVGVWSVLRGPYLLGTLVGVGLVLLAFLLRFDAAILALVITAPFLIVDCLRRETSLQRYGLMLSLVLIGLGAQFAGTHAYRTIAPDYYEYNALRGQLNDNPNADLAPEELPPSVSETNFLLLTRFFPDPTMLGLDELRDLTAAVEAREAALSPEDFIESLSILASKPLVLLIAALGTLLAVFAPSRGIFLARALGLAVLLLAFDYVATTAILKDRVVNVGCAAYLVAAFHQPQVRAGRVRAILLIGLASCMVLYLGYESMLRLKNTRNKLYSFEAERALIQTWDGDVIVFPGDHSLLNGSGLFSSDFAMFEDRVSSTGWLTNHPQNTRFTGHSQLLDDDTVLFTKRGRVDIVSEMLTGALLENYGVASRAEVVSRGRVHVLLKFEELDDTAVDDKETVPTEN